MSFPYRRNETNVPDMNAMGQYYSLKYQILKEDYDKKVKQQEEKEKSEQKRMLEDMQKKVNKLQKKKKKLEGDVNESESESESEEESKPEEEKINVSLMKGRKDIRARTRKSNATDFISAAKQALEDS